MTTSQPDPSQYETIKQLVLSGQREQARELLARMVKEYPNDAHAWYGLAQVMDDPDRVKFCLQRAQALMPASQVIRDQLAQLDAPVSAVDLSPAALPINEDRAGGPAILAGQVSARVDINPAASVASPAAVGSAHVGSLDDFATDAHVSTGVERRRNRMKLRFLLGLPALLVLCCLIGFAVSGQMANLAQTTGGHTVIYRAEGTARSNRINYLSSIGASVTLDPQALPWTKTLQMTDPIPPTLIVNSHEPNTTVTCVITVDGIEVARKSSHGNQPQIVCRWEFPQTP